MNSNNFKCDDGIIMNEALLTICIQIFFYEKKPTNFIIINEFVQESFLVLLLT